MHSLLEKNRKNFARGVYKLEQKVLSDYEHLSRAVSDFIVDYVNQNPNSLLCLAGGHTPLRTFELLVEANKKKLVNFEQCKFVSLDEWVGLGRDTKGSCKETLYNQLFEPLTINEDQICFFDGLSKDLDFECKRVDDFIRKNGSIDLVLLGVGMNGHLGFNEPGTDPDLYSHIVPLDPVTTEVSSKYFEGKKEVTKGISLGIKHLREADKVMIMANGLKKAAIIKESFTKELNIQVPSSLLQKHENLYVFLDGEAASELRHKI